MYIQCHSLRDTGNCWLKSHFFFSVLTEPLVFCKHQCIQSQQMNNDLSKPRIQLYYPLSEASLLLEVKVITCLNSCQWDRSLQGVWGDFYIPDKSNFFLIFFVFFAFECRVRMWCPAIWQPSCDHEAILEKEKPTAFAWQSRDLKEAWIFDDIIESPNQPAPNLFTCSWIHPSDTVFYLWFPWCLFSLCKL